MTDYTHPTYVISGFGSNFEDLILNPEHGHEFPLSQDDVESIRAWEVTIALLRLEAERLTEAIDRLAESLERVKRGGE